jgi:hypothetical protein
MTDKEKPEFGKCFFCKSNNPLRPIVLTFTLEGTIGKMITKIVWQCANCYYKHKGD